MVEPGPPENGRDTDDGFQSSTVTTMFGLLANTERRIALHVLRKRRDERIEIHDLAETVSTAWPCDASLDSTTVEVTLRHAHLPKLAAAGIVEYDDQSGTVRYDGNPVLETLLKVVADADGV